MRQKSVCWKVNCCILRLQQTPYINYTQYGGELSSRVRGIQYEVSIPSGRWRVFSTADVSHHQYGGGTSSVRWKGLMVCGKDLSHHHWHQYGCVTSSIRWKVCSSDLSNHQYGGGCAVEDYQNCSENSWWLYLSGQNDILQTILL